MVGVATWKERGQAWVNNQHLVTQTTPDRNRNSSGRDLCQWHPAIRHRTAAWLSGFFYYLGRCRRDIYGDQKGPGKLALLDRH